MKLFEVMFWGKESIIVFAKDRKEVGRKYTDIRAVYEIIIK